MEKKPKIETETIFYSKEKTERHGKGWWNWHNTIDVGGSFELIYRPFNEYEDGSRPDGARPFTAGIAGLKTIVKKAKDENKRIRVFASRWSLNNIAYSDAYMVTTAKMEIVKVGLEQEYVNSNFDRNAEHLAFVQCGVRVKELNGYLEAAQLALPTSGASDGQLFVGAVSTGTHGAAHEIGAMQDYVRGIHVVTLEDELIFIQRKSDPVVNEEYCRTMLENTRLVEDDDLFNAAVVGFGSFGLIHGMMIEAVPIYRLERFVKRYPLDDNMRTLMADPSEENLTFLGVPGKTEVPFHFEVVINPYYKDSPHVYNPAFVRLFYFQEVGKRLGVKEVESEALGSNDVMTVVNNQFKADALQVALKTQMPNTNGVEAGQYPGNVFKGDGAHERLLPYRGTSVEIGIPRSEVLNALDLLIKTVNQHPFYAPLAFRYVKKSTAMLAFTTYEDTVTIEMPGFDDPMREARDGHQAVFEAFANSNIPHTYHWGQNLPINHAWIEKAYGEGTVELWMNKRKAFLGEQGCHVFSNDLVDGLGLNS